ncbi:MAG TPA: hypothetical protein VFU19_09215 [Iamia sp.]|nr:hypothetical protein [Iamia sp.]
MRDRTISRRLLGLLAGLLVAGATLIGPAQPASAGHVADFSAVPFGSWGGAWGSSHYRWKLDYNAWSPWGDVRALGTTCQEWETQAEVEWIIGLSTEWNWGIQVILPNGTNPPIFRYFICKGFGPV